MEYVSLLAGGRFSDDPVCTHRALASLARLVNDHIGDDAVRARLVELAPQLLVLGGRDPRVRCAVVLRCLGTAAGLAPLPPHAGDWRAAAVARIERLRRGGRRERLGIRCWELLHPAGVQVASAFGVLLSAAGSLEPRARDQLLGEVLGEALREACLLVGLPMGSPAVSGSRVVSAGLGAGSP